MATQIKVWEIQGDKIVARDNAAFADAHKEDELEEWISQNPDILGEKLLVIARQLIIPEVGRLDLLCMDENGKLVIVEFKRASLPREAVAQGLDYASWLNSATEEEILAYANQYLQKKSGDAERTLPDAFAETFGAKELPEWVCQNHRILLVAAGLDASAERIINYLAQKQIGINAAFFNYCELSDKKQILVRSVLVPDSINPAKTGGGRRVTEAELMAMAQDRKTVDLVTIGRQMRNVWDERPESTAGGSFRYWTNPQTLPVHGINVMVYGINVAGDIANPPPGELDIWIRTEALAKVSGISEETIKQRLSTFKSFGAGKMKSVIRLKNLKDAELLVAQLKEFVAQQMKKVAATV